MKSIVEEASSIGKAIEQAWNRAGKPADFSVKIFEEAKKNLFGFVAQSAKIGLFFDHRISTLTPRQQPSVKEQKPVEYRQEPRPHQTNGTTPQKPKLIAWSSDMVDYTKEWIQQTLTIMGLPNISFDVTVSGNLAKIRFSTLVTGQQPSDKMLFSSLAHLLMSSLQQKYKRSLHHMKVVLISS